MSCVSCKKSDCHFVDSSAGEDKNVSCNDWSKTCGSMCSKMFNRQNQTGKGQRAKTGISEAGAET